MKKLMYVTALCLGALLAANGCTTEDTQTGEQEIVIGGEQCGTNVCGKGMFCCNASCGMCAPVGGGCPQVACAIDGEAAAAPAELASAPERIGPILGGEQCGPTTCGSGTRCCNASCGVCTAPGQECTQQVCNPTE